MTSAAVAMIWASAIFPAQAQTSIDASGPYLHQGSGATFPEQVGSFHRTSLTQFDEEGANVGAGYRHDGAAGTVIVTHYIYPAPLAVTPLNEQRTLCTLTMESAELAILDRYPGHQRITSRPPRARPGTQLAGLRSSFRFTSQFQGQEQPVVSQLDLYCFVNGPWMVKYRATAPAAVELEQIVDDFIGASAWPR